MTSAPLATPASGAQHFDIDVEGTVQGVGFRPFVYRLAQALELGGFVRNDAGGVHIEVEGPSAALERFLARLAADAPAHARIARLRVARTIARGYAPAFHVVPSERGSLTTARIPADLCTCGDCLRELFDPADRRYRYPFINCTACGPRFTIARDFPYDRATTTMRDFPMCDACRAEYEHPRDRRFHAEPIACPRCGPRLYAYRTTGGPASFDATVTSDDALAAAVDALRRGEIVAVKGLGGYHLAARADDDAAVARLRARKRRDAKPFALMVASLRAARRLAHVDSHEARLMSSAARPIVLVVARRDAASGRIARGVAPRVRELGIMLPYTPLHHLILASAGVPLVMTSGNASDEPIVYRDRNVGPRLGHVADLILAHDREIEAPCDDSVARVVSVAGRRQPLFIRRSRGYVPDPLPLPATAAEPIVAVGGQLKNTVCVSRGADALLGAHCGDLGEAGTFAAFVRSIERMERLAGKSSRVVAHDEHPEYESSRYARDGAYAATESVQHHHAHLAGVLAEYGVRESAVGVIFDGAGFGSDGVIWGGEVLVGDFGGFSRAAHLRSVAMPGGEAAVREPWRMACAWLTEIADGAVPPVPGALRLGVSSSRWNAVSRLAAGGHAPRTTSVGRLLDACAALCGICPRINYEGQAAIEFGALASRVATACDPYAVALNDGDDGALTVIDPAPLLRAVVRDAEAGRPLAEISSAAHLGLVYAAKASAVRAAHRARLNTVVLSGGVFQNVLLLERLAALLAADGLRVLVPRRAPPNDGGLSYGQAAVAAWRQHTSPCASPSPHE